MLGLTAKVEAERGWIDRKEPRVKVLVRIQIRGAGALKDACIRDVSTCGLLLQADEAPARGTIIELVGPFPPVVARVVWTGERRFGVQAQGRIKVSDFLAGKKCRQIAADADATPTVPACAHDDREAEDRSKQIGRLFQYGAVIAIAAGMALFLAETTYTILSKVSASVEMGLERKY